jgi:hypothetical protein
LRSPGQAAAEGARAAGAALSPSEGDPSGVGQAKAASTNRVAMPELGRSMAGATAPLDCAQGGRPGVMLGLFFPSLICDRSCRNEDGLCESGGSSSRW